MPDLHVFVRDGLVILAIGKEGCATIPIRSFAPNDADAFAESFAATVREMADSARRHWITVEELKRGVK
jgi:hypothetical protein